MNTSTAGTPARREPTASRAEGATLRVRDLEVRVADSERRLLSDISFLIEPGSTVGIVGPSGAGKSTLALALMRLLPRGTTLGPHSEVHLGDDALHTLAEPDLRTVRGRRMAMVFQEPLVALNPAVPVGLQVAEAALVHGTPPAEARDRAREMLAKVGLADTRDAAARYPHELSGGMRQRVLIASAMMLTPAVLIADEPTTALDPTVQAQVLDLLDRLREEIGTTLILISHDLDVVGERCGRVIALDAGRVVQDAATADVLRDRRRPVRNAGSGAAQAATEPLLTVQDLSVRYRAPSGGFGRPFFIHAVEEFSLTIARGEVVGLVGESGCGKTSAAHAILRLIEPTTGRVCVDGTDIRTLGHSALRRLRQRLQLVPQDAGASLTPHLTAEALVAEGLEVHGRARGDDARRRARALLEEVGLPAPLARALPRQLSSGERARVAIARALAPEPDLLVCDEPLASMDARAGERVLALLQALRESRGLTLLVISHDLDAVRRLASRVLVMYLGRIVESSAGSTALANPRMPYTQALAAAVPTGDPTAPRRRLVLPGEIPSPGSPPAGCAFHPRCPHPLKDDRCALERPPLQPVAPNHLAACWKLPHPTDP